MDWLGYVHAWPGGLSCQVTFWLPQMGSCTSRFVRSWVKGGRVVTLWWQFVRAGRLCQGKGFTHERAMASSTCVAGWCGNVPRLCVCFFPFRGVRRFARVGPTIIVPCFSAVACFGAPCCVVLCCAVLCLGGLCCVAVSSVLSCRASPCLALAWRAVRCCAVPCCVVLRCVVLLAALSRCVAGWCAAVRYTVLPLVVPCSAVPWCVVGPFRCLSGVGWGRRWLYWPALWCGKRAEAMWLDGGQGARLCVVPLVAPALRGAGWVFWPGESGGCLRGCPP